MRMDEYMEGEPLGEDGAHLVGRWRACGLREGLDMLRADGRLSYYPVGRGSVAFSPDGGFELTAVTGAGKFTREGRWALRGGLLRIRIGEDSGLYYARSSENRLVLAPARETYGCADKLLHRAEFEKEV